jgi:hypothetical protein
MKAARKWLIQEQNCGVYVWFVENVSKFQVRMWDHHAYFIDDDIFFFIYEGDTEFGVEFAL